jgi:hypothetical protein
MSRTMRVRVCLKIKKNLILVLIERYSVVLRHANHYLTKLNIFLYVELNSVDRYFEMEKIRCKGEDSI